MITVGVTYAVLPGKEQEFESVSAKVLEALKGTPGHSESRLFKDD